MKLIIYTLIILFILSTELLAQKLEFKVLAVKGKISVVKKGTKKPVKIFSGDKLFAGDEVKVESDSYIGLVHSTGRTIELNKSGSYNVTKLSKDVSSTKSNLTKRFAEYVYDNISDADDLLSREDYHNKMKTVGAVERAAGEDVNVIEKAEEITGSSHELSSQLNKSGVKSESDILFRARIPRSSYLLDSKVDFSWYKYPNTKEYTFSLTDRNGKVITRTNVKDTTITLDADKLGILKDNCYYWYVTANDKTSDEYCIVWMSDNLAAEIKSSLKNIEGDLGTKKDAMDYIILASFYEEYNLMDRAVKAYQESINLAPGVKDYKKLYASYLDRIGLTSEARSLIK